jgi:transcriptional regulator with XRE-family HTH domain
MHVSPLRKAREGKFTQAEAARRLGISWRTLLRWEKPHFRPESLPLEKLEAIASLYSVPIEEIVAPPPDRQPA